MFSFLSLQNLNVEPLKGKAALLGEKKTLSFCDVSTGKGLKNGSCFTVAKEGILCEFNAKRNLTKWVDLSVSHTSYHSCTRLFVARVVCHCHVLCPLLSGSIAEYWLLSRN